MEGTLRFSVCAAGTGALRFTAKLEMTIEWEAFDVIPIREYIEARGRFYAVMSSECEGVAGGVALLQRSQGIKAP